MSAFASDTELFHAFRQGEEAAIKRLYALHFKPLCFFAQRLTGDKQEAEDMVTESFISMLRKRETFQNLNNVKSFLYLSTKNACINRLKAKQRQQSIHQQIRHLNTEEDEPLNLMGEEMLRLEVLAAIHAEIENLPGRCKEIFKLIFMEGLNTDEIARRLEISPQTVRTQKARAIELIKSSLLKKDLFLAVLYLSLLIPSGQPGN